LFEDATMLIALFLGVMILFGGSGDTLFGQPWLDRGTTLVKGAVKDEARRKLALQADSLVRRDLKELNKHVEKTGKQFEKLVRNYQSTPEEFDDLFSSALATRKRHVNALLDDREAMLKHIRLDEWQIIVAGLRQTGK